MAKRPHTITPAPKDGYKDAPDLWAQQPIEMTRDALFDIFGRAYVVGCHGMTVTEEVRRASSTHLDKNDALAEAGFRLGAAAESCQKRLDHFEWLLRQFPVTRFRARHRLLMGHRRAEKILEIEQDYRLKVEAEREQLDALVGKQPAFIEEAETLCVPEILERERPVWVARTTYGLEPLAVMPARIIGRSVARRLDREPCKRRASPFDLDIFYRLGPAETGTGAFNLPDEARYPFTDGRTQMDCDVWGVEVFLSREAAVKHAEEVVARFASGLPETAA